VTAAAAASCVDDAPASTPRLHAARVLLVEDNPVNMLIAAATLTQWGVQVEARDGRTTMQVPVMSGHEATIELRKDWSRNALPMIALTAAALVSEREQALAAGMNDFLTKPIDAPKLRRVVASHVRRAPGTEATVAS
jgi:CheY-like chemotaxis protein